MTSMPTNLLYVDQDSDRRGRHEENAKKAGLTVLSTAQLPAHATVPFALLHWSDRMLVDENVLGPVQSVLFFSGGYPMDIEAEVLEWRAQRGKRDTFLCRRSVTSRSPLSEEELRQLSARFAPGSSQPSPLVDSCAFPYLTAVAFLATGATHAIPTHQPSVESAAWWQHVLGRTREEAETALNTELAVLSVASLTTGVTELIDAIYKNGRVTRDLCSKLVSNFCQPEVAQWL